MVQSNNVIIQYGGEGDRKLLCSPSDFRAAKDSIFWKDIYNYLTDRIELIQRDFEVCSPEDLTRLQAEIANLRFLQELPDFLEKQAEDKNNVENHE